MNKLIGIILLIIRNHSTAQPLSVSSKLWDYITMEHWQLQIHTKQETAANLHSLYNKVLSWSELFTLCSIEEKKMIIAQLLKEVRIKKNYELEIDFNVMISQILGYQQTALSA